MDHLVYLDHAATTAARPEVVEAMLPYFTEKYGNPSSIYSLGSETKAAITHAREIMAKSIGTTSENIYFTAGGSESDNWALVATAEAYASKGKHIITSKIEHHAILHTCDYLASRGYGISLDQCDWCLQLMGNIPKKFISHIFKFLFLLNVLLQLIIRSLQFRYCLFQLI